MQEELINVQKSNAQEMGERPSDCCQDLRTRRKPTKYAGMSGWQQTVPTQSFIQEPHSSQPAKSKIGSTPCTSPTKHHSSSLPACSASHTLTLRVRFHFLLSIHLSNRLASLRPSTPAVSLLHFSCSNTNIYHRAQEHVTWSCTDPGSLPLAACMMRSKLLQLFKTFSRL